MSVQGGDTFWQVYGQDSGTVYRENFVEFRPHVPRVSKAIHNPKAKLNAWRYAAEIAASLEKGSKVNVVVRITKHEPGGKVEQVWSATPGTDNWARMLRVDAASK